MVAQLKLILFRRYSHIQRSCAVIDTLSPRRPGAKALVAYKIHVCWHTRVFLAIHVLTNLPAPQAESRAATRAACPGFSGVMTGRRRHKLLRHVRARRVRHGKTIPRESAMRDARRLCHLSAVWRVRTQASQIRMCPSVPTATFLPDAPRSGSACAACPLN